MSGYFKILTAVPGFFMSALFLMLLWGAIAPDIGIVPASITYVQSMLITIVLWLAVAPLAAAGKKGK